MGSGASIKRAILAATTLSLLTIFSAPSVEASSLKFTTAKFEEIKFSSSLSVSSSSEELGQVSPDHLVNFNEGRGIVDVSHKTGLDRLVYYSDGNNQSITFMEVVKSRSQSTRQSGQQSDLELDTPNFFGSLIMFICLMGSVMTITPIMMMKNYIR